MPERTVMVCSKCGVTIDDDPMLGDKQGGRVHIVMPGFTWDLVLCTKHKQPLYDLYEDCVDRVIPGGTAVGADTIRYLPRVTDSEDGVQPPQFSGEK